jgi:hypothetical protein
VIRPQQQQQAPNRSQPQFRGTTTSHRSSIVREMTTGVSLMAAPDIMPRIVPRTNRGRGRMQIRTKARDRGCK